MSSTYEETKETRTYTKKTLISVNCDRCGAEIPEEGVYETRDLDLRFTTGSSYPEGGSKEGWQVEDLCDGCVASLELLLTKWGATVTPYEIDW
jgi:hypothetical protein